MALFGDGIIIMLLAVCEVVLGITTSASVATACMYSVRTPPASNTVLLTKRQAVNCTFHDAFTVPTPTANKESWLVLVTSRRARTRQGAIICSHHSHCGCCRQEGKY
eukprot:211640-Rhodomonas_salina.1